MCSAAIGIGVVLQASIRYIVDDVDEAIRFYTESLGFEVDMHPAPGFAALSGNGLRLLLNAPGAGGAGTAGGSPQPGGWNRFQVEVADIEATWWWGTGGARFCWRILRAT